MENNEVKNKPTRKKTSTIKKIVKDDVGPVVIDKIVEEEKNTVQTPDLTIATDISNPIVKDEIKLIHQLKADESVFSPKPVPYKLIAGKQNYGDIEGINEDGIIYIRRYTSIEENMFKELVGGGFTFQKLFEILNRTFETAVRSDIDTYKLNMVEQMGLFLAIFKLTYGTVVEADITCNECEYTDNTRIDLNSIKTKYMGPKDSLRIPIHLTSYEKKYVMMIKFPTLEEELIYLDDTVKWETKIKLLVKSIVDEDGNKLNAEDYLNMIINLNYDDKTKIKEGLELVSKFSVDIEKVKGFVCKNKKCTEVGNTQNFEIPIEALFKKIFASII